MARSRKDAPQPMTHNVHEALAPLLVPVGTLTPDPENARQHSEGNIEAIKTSLTRFQQRKPIVVKKDGMIVTAGNGTLTAAKQLGWTHIAAVVVDDDDSMAKAWAISDNRSAELANWDYEQLVSDFVGLKEDGLDLTSLGWDQAELDMLLQSAFVPDQPGEMPGSTRPSETDSQGSEPNIDKTSMKVLRVAYYKHAINQETIGQFLVRVVNAHHD